MGRHNLFAHATDPNMSIAVSMKDRFYPEDHYPVDWGYLDIVFQNTYSYFPPFIRYHGYAAYLELVQQAYPETPFVALECGYSTSPQREGTIFCATDAPCPETGTVPLPLSLCFGTNSEEDQARGFAARWKEIEGLTAGFFVFEYFDEWWKGSNASEFVQDDDKAEEWFGIKGVSGTPDDFTVRNKPAFDTVASMYDMGWCPTEVRCSASSEGFRIVISPAARSGVESIVVRRDDGQTGEVDMGSEPLTYIDPAPLMGTHLYTIVSTKAYVECAELTCSSSFQEQFLRGDSNGDGTVDLSDAVTTLGYLFLGNASILCRDAADADDKGTVEITDAIYLLQHLFVGGPAIPPPGISQCGPDPTADVLPACIQPESACAR